MENWKTFVDPAKRFTLFYPPDLTAKGKDNFLSSTDLTLTKQNSPKQFRITVTYSLNDTNLNYPENKTIIPAFDLKNLEAQVKPAFQIYKIVNDNLSSYDLYGYPTTGNIVDYTKYDGESGRTLNVLGIIQGKNSFVMSYSNTIEAFYKYLPTMNDIIKTVVLLK
jgi:hypothetical protein